jgi:hypothetical protein
MRSAWTLAGRLAMGAFAACLVLAFVGLASGDPGGGGQGNPNRLCTGCTNADRTDGGGCDACIAASYSGTCWDNGTCTHHTAGSCDIGCWCQGGPNNTYVCN